ncbi:MAG: Cyclopentanol dehydrogenase [Syntrophomonadaceae bacterium]|nr:Cyclopentanol dehydrogenase [Bacillota bacterium]
MKKNNRVVLITGASSGIGKACAQHLQEQGYQVFGTSRHPQSEAVELSQPGTRQSSGSLEMIEMDVNDDDSVNQTIDTVFKKASRLDAVVNNAGFGLAGAIEDTSTLEAKSQLETNFFGVLRVCRAALPIMRRQGSGYIVNISSLAGLISVPFQGLYSASKFALEGLTEALRMEVRPFGIKVVLIEPGDFGTPFTAHRHKTIQSQKNPVYAEPFKRALGVMEASEMKGPSPDKIARLLERIIRNSSPHLRYRIGPNSSSVLLRKFMPAWLFEWAVMKNYKLV